MSGNDEKAPRSLSWPPTAPNYPLFAAEPQLDLQPADAWPSREATDRHHDWGANALPMTGSALPNTTELEIADGEPVTAIATFAVGTADDRVDTRVFAGELY